MSNIEVVFNKDKNLITINNQSMVFHCNHYNRYLQQTIEDAEYIDYEKILIKSSAEVVFDQLTEHFNKNPNLSFTDKLAYASELFKHCGFGILEFSDLKISGGKVIGKFSHYGNASKLNFGHRSKPAEYFDKGFIIGTLSAISGSLLGNFFEDDLKITQNKSISLNDENCEFEIILDETRFKKELENFSNIPSRKFETGVDEDLIIGAVSGMPLIGDEEGLIPAFGVYLTKMYADYYNKISFRFEREMKMETGTYDLARELLIESGVVCAFNTFGGIMLSAEWKALIKPMLKDREDWIHGIISVINCLGWGVWRVEEIVPYEKLVIRVYEDYESLGYLKWFGKADRPINYLVTGGCLGLMNLLYNGDITQEPELTKDYYVELFSGNNNFKAVQTKCLAMGDEYTEVVVSK